MKKLLFLFLLFSTTAGAQKYLGRIVTETTPPPSGGGDTPQTIERTLIFDDFDGSSLSNRWAVRRPDKQTISVSDGFLKVEGRADTVPAVTGYSFYRAKSFQLRIYDTSYGQSMMRSFTVETGGVVKKLSDTTLGIYNGAASVWNNYYTDAYMCYDFRNDTLIALGIDDTIYHHPPFGFLQNALTQPVDSGDYLITRIRFTRDTSFAFVKNVTKNDSGSTYLPYRYDIITYPLSPLTFHYTFGVMGRTSFWFDYIHVTTPEIQNPGILYIGDSKPTGYLGGDADSNTAYMLRPYADTTIGLWAGPGATVTSTFDCLKEYRNNSPTVAVILDLGTNSGGSFSDYVRLVDSLSIIAGGIPVYKLLTPNGGDPLTAGTWNYQIKNQFPTTYIDTWSGTGYETMSTGNGMMADPVHPTTPGQRNIALKIKAALPVLFPN